MIYVSILIPSIYERLDKLEDLVGKLHDQIDEIEGGHDMIEIKTDIDNKHITIGAKREELKNRANGKYFCFLDDDDDCSDDYIEELLAVAKHEEVDVICFDSWANISGKEGQISVSMNNLENNQFLPGRITYRRPSHVNAWLTEKFQQYEFTDKMYGEDFDFCYKCYPHLTSSFKIDKILHYYTYDADVTQAFEKKEENNE